MCFVFDLVNVDGSRSHSGMKPVPWKLTTMKQVIAKWQHALYEQGWNSIYMENHDRASDFSLSASFFVSSRTAFDYCLIIVGERKLIFALD